MPLPKPLPALQQELRDLLTDDLSIALQATKTYLPEGGARYQQVLALIARLNDANKERYRNTLSADDYQRRVDTIRANSFDLIESLQESDFTAPRPKTTQRKNRNARRKKQARLWHQPAFWGGLATLVTLLIALLAYLNDLGVFPFRPKDGAQDRAANTRSQAAAACGFPDTFDSTHLYILITRFEDFANDNETECYGRSIESRIDMVKNREKLPVKICYLDSLSPNQSEQADRLRDLYHADLIIWGKLRNAGPECSADGLCLNFQPSDTLIRYAGGEVRKKVDNEYRPNISAADLESGLISMGAESFDAWLISMVNMKIGQRKPEFYRIAEDWPVERKAEEYERRGDLFKLINEKDKSIADYTEAFRLRPNRSILLTRALAYLYWEDFEKSISDCSLVLSFDSTAAPAYMIRGRSKLFLDKYEDALLDFDKYISFDSSQPLIYYWRGLLNMEIGKNEEAIKDLSRSIMLDSTDADYFVLRADVYDNLNMKNEALIDYDRAININTELSIAWCNRGVVKSRMGKTDEAISDYKKSIELDSKIIQAFYNLGCIKLDNGEERESIFYFNKAISNDPSHSFAYFNRGLAKSALGQNRSAILDYDTAVTINPGFARAYHSRGLVKVQMGRYQEAINDYGLAIRNDSSVAVVYDSRGIANSKLNREVEAVSDHTMAIKLDSSVYSYFLNRGISLRLLAKHEDAIVDFDHALALASTNPSIYSNRLKSNLSTGRYLQAAHDFFVGMHYRFGIWLYLYFSLIFIYFNRHKFSDTPLFRSLIQTLSHHLSRAYLRFRIFLRHL